MARSALPLGTCRARAAVAAVLGVGRIGLRHGAATAHGRAGCACLFVTDWAAGGPSGVSAKGWGILAAGSGVWPHPPRDDHILFLHRRALPGRPRPGNAPAGRA